MCYEGPAELGILVESLDGGYLALGSIDWGRQKHWDTSGTSLQFMATAVRRETGTLLPASRCLSPFGSLYLPSEDRVAKVKLPHGLSAQWQWSYVLDLSCLDHTFRERIRIQE